MAREYDAAVATLYQAPYDSFVAERKRLVKELETGGDKTAAARLSKATRPLLSAWVTNQLWWKERKAFDELFSTAERLRDIDADADATAAHRDAIAKLRARAGKLLADAGKSASEATLRRVTSTLTALAATGSFDPDPPGALKGDRDPPGFDVVGLTSFGTGRAERTRTPSTEPARSRRERAGSARADKAAELAERRRVEREQARVKAERERLERRLRIAESTLEARQEEVARLKEKLAEAEQDVRDGREAVRELERELRKHDAAPPPE